MAFTTEEIDYLRTQPLVGGSGPEVLLTRKIRNVESGCREVALVVDDMVSFDPFIARGIRIYGRADAPVERDGMVGPGYYLRVSPTISWSWNMEGVPVGDSWYDARRAIH